MTDPEPIRMVDDVLRAEKKPPPPDWIELPIYRGFTEIAQIYEMVTENNAVICGGYARYCASPRRNPVPASDVDVFPRDKEAFGNCLQDFTELGYSVRHENNMSTTLKSPDAKPWALMPTVQLIKPVVEGRIVSTGSTEEILSNFDFTVVRVGFVSPTKVMADGWFAEDEKNRILRLRNIHCPVSSMLRCMKYARKGYWMRPSEAIRLFDDWDSRSDEYKSRLFEAFLKSETGDITEEEIDELEALLRID